jgi:hypothetical protein
MEQSARPERTPILLVVKQAKDARIQGICPLNRLILLLIVRLLQKLLSFLQLILLLIVIG